MINSETSRQLEGRVNCGSVAKRLLSLISAVSTVALMSGVTPVQAQAVIEEITITAQKRAESIQDVPISVTALSGDFIESNGIDNIRDVALFTPNMNITTQNTIGNTQITIRGVGSPGNSGIEPSVAVFVDGVYLARAAAVLGSLSDIETFEVLRGPQGTLFGRNTPMGALNITTRAPTQELEGFLQLTAGNLEQRSVKGYINGALSKTLSARASFVMTDRQGYTKNLVVGKRTNEIEEYGGRVKLLWEPTEGFDATIIADYMKTNGSYGESEAFNFTDKYLDTIEASFGVRPTDDKFDHVTGDAFNDDAGTDENYGLSVQANWQLGDHTLTSISAYRDWNNVYTGDIGRQPAATIGLLRPQGLEQFSQELRILSPTGEKFEYVAGLFFYTEKYFLGDIFFAAPGLCLLPRYTDGTGRADRVADCPVASADPAADHTARFDNKTNSYAGYFQGTYNFTDKISLTGGIRYTRDEKNGTYTAQTRTTLDFLRAVDPKFVGSRTDKKVTWMVNGRYFLNEDVMFFTTVSTGSKSGGFNGRPNATVREFDPERSMNYEVGVKSILFEGLLMLNATLYRTKLEDFQDTVFDGETTSFNVLNAGDLQVQGLELDFQANPIEHLSIQGGLAYLDSKFTDYRNAPVPTALKLGDLPTIIVNESGNLVQDLTGKRRQKSPKWQSTLSVTWTDTVPGTSDLEWFVRGQWQYMDEHFLSGDLDPISLEPSFSLFNARIAIGKEDGGWQLAAWVKNLTDKDYCVSRFDQPLGGVFNAQRVQRCNLSAPRTWGMTATFRF